MPPFLFSTQQKMTTRVDTANNRPRTTHQPPERVPQPMPSGSTRPLTEGMPQGYSGRDSRSEGHSTPLQQEQSQTSQQQRLDNGKQDTIQANSTNNGNTTGNSNSVSNTNTNDSINNTGGKGVNNANNNTTATSTSNSGSSSSSNKKRNIIASHYQIAQKIGEGSFGIIFKGFDLLRSNQPVAIKFESRKSDAPQLKDEFRAYKILNSAVNNYYRNYEQEKHRYLSVQGVPKVYFFGQEGYYNILIIQLLGPSLEDLFEWCGRRFSMSTVARLAIQMIERLQFVHENNLIYRDIKPDNFLIGANHSDNTIYLVDFGMVKQYRDPINHVHIPYKERKSLSGTARYMSINTHLGREQSRRDDLESLGNVFVYFLKGQLPWQGLKAPTNKLKYEKIGERKQKIPIPELCNGLPPQVGEYIRRVRSLKFEEDPDYFGYIQLFEQILETTSSPGGVEYDWMRLNDGEGWSWNKNKKINLNGYGSGVRNPGTQQTHTSQSPQQQQQQAQQAQQAQLQQQQQYQQQQQQQLQQQQMYAQQKYQQLNSSHRAMSHSHSQHSHLHNGAAHTNLKGHRISATSGKMRAMSTPTTPGYNTANERTGLLGGIGSGGGRQSYVDEYGYDVERSAATSGSWFGWLCCCMW